jgi:hypothetical protein
MSQHVYLSCVLLYQYRGVWLLLVSGLGIFLAWVWYMLFLAFEVSERGTPTDATQASTEGTFRQYFCGDWQWILLMCDGCIMGGYFLRSFRILKVSACDWPLAIAKLFSP